MSDEFHDDDDATRRPFDGFKIEIDPKKVEEAIQQIRDRVRESFKSGRYTKVRISYKGRQLLPDVPFALFLATEGAAFWLTSPLLAVLFNLGANTVLDVEFLHEADELVQEGLSHYLDGELEEAEKCYRNALERRPDDPAALYNLGTLLRVTGRAEEALTVLRRAAMGPEGHPDVLRATEAVDRLTNRKKTL
ncbi:MAG: tetratricopeptide repeat protein [Proteobacteria bacterium]|nr:tetratricopeptide repeat protein [Pseudomonadota bacterium]